MAGSDLHPLAISLVVPLFDEEDNVDELVRRSLEALGKVSPEHELILVNDGSHDRTLERIQAACEAHPEVRGLSLRRRFGKGEALAAGLSVARGRWIATIDADLQEDPGELPDLCALLENDHDLVCGWRKDRKDSLGKRLSSSVFNAIVRMTTGVKVHDINCGFKVMRRELAEELLLSAGRFRYIPLVAHWWGYRVAEKVVTHSPRLRGTSSFGGERLPGALVDLVTHLCMVRFHARPGTPFMFMGGLSFLLGFVICTYIAGLFFEHGNIQSRHPLLAFGVLLLTIGVQLVATGFLGEWLAYRTRGAGDEFRVAWRDTSDGESDASRGDGS